MTILQALVLGVIQGVTEFLPISSSGHLLIPSFLGWPEQGIAFDVVIHLATLLVIVVVFKKDLQNIFGAMKSRRDEDVGLRRVGWSILAGAIPVGIAGLLLSPYEGVLRRPSVVIFSLAFWGLVLMLADIRTRRRALLPVSLPETGKRRALFIALAQAVAFIPGTSRSGISITAGLLVGLDRATAARMAFLAGVPVIALAGLKGLADVVVGAAAVPWAPLVAAFLAAFVSGYAAVKFLLRLLSNAGYVWFGVYRLLLAAILLWFTQ